MYNQLPTTITSPINEDISPATYISTLRSAVTMYDDNILSNDSDSYYTTIGSTLPATANNATTLSGSVERPNFIDKTSSDTFIDVLALPQQDLPLNWRTLNNTFYSSNSTLMSSTVQINEDDLVVFNGSSIPLITRAEYLFDNDTYTNIQDMNDYIISSSLTTPSVIDLTDDNNMEMFIPFYFDNKREDQFLGHAEPMPTFIIPPFSWILNMAVQNKSQSLNSATTTKNQTIQLTTTTSQASDILYEYCKNRQCYHGGRLNSDCLCICLPAFTGDNCETGCNIFFYLNTNRSFFQFM